MLNWWYIVYVLDAYEPKSLQECINKSTILSLDAWYKNHKKPCLLVGPVGIGKSILVRLFAKEHNLTLYELTPSDDRDKETLEPILHAVSQSKSIFSNKNLLFFDDIDVFVAEDKGGFETILKCVKESRNPVIFCATNMYADRKLAQLREMCEIIEMRHTSTTILTNYISQMCLQKKIKFEKDAIEDLIKMNSGDLRAIFLDMNYLSPFGITKKNLELLSGRERKADVFKTIIGLFKAKTFNEAQKIANATELDFDMLFAWITENLHLFYEKDNLKEAYRFAALADLNKSRIYSRQNWVFFKYFLALGIISPCLIPKKDQFTFKISYPQSIKLKTRELSEYSRNKKAAQILSKVFRGSVSKISGEIFLYRFFFNKGGFTQYLLEHLPDEDLLFLQDFFKFKFFNTPHSSSLKEEPRTKDIEQEKENKEKEERKVVPKKEEIEIKHKKLELKERKEPTSEKKDQKEKEKKCRILSSKEENLLQSVSNPKLETQGGIKEKKEERKAQHPKKEEKQRQRKLF